MLIAFQVPKEKLPSDMARAPKHASRLYKMPNMRSHLGLGRRACPKGRSWPFSHSKGKGCQRCKVVGARQSVKRPSTSHGLVSSRWSPRIPSHYLAPIGSSPAPQPAASNGDATATDFRDSQEPTDVAQHSRWPATTTDFRKTGFQRCRPQLTKLPSVSIRQTSTNITSS